MTENEIKVTGKEIPRIGVFVGHCGFNVAGVLDPPFIPIDPFLEMVKEKLI